VFIHTLLGALNIDTHDLKSFKLYGDEYSIQLGRQLHFLSIASLVSDIGMMVRFFYKVEENTMTWQIWFVTPPFLTIIGSVSGPNNF